MAAPAWFVPPDPVDAHTARAVHRTERVPPAEWALRAALIEDAADLIRKYRDARETPHDYPEAVRWVRSDDRGQPFSFRNVCDVLGLDAACARTAILDGVPAKLVPVRPFDRLLAWGAEQAEPWGAGAAAEALDLPIDQVRGVIAAGLSNRKVERVRQAYSREAGLYRVRR